MLDYVYDDGGRSEHFRGEAGDCVTRAIAIATGMPYMEVYRALSDRLGSTPRNGVPRRVYEPYLESLGWKWVPTMRIGSGCRVHMRSHELPAASGRIIVRLSKHLAAVVDYTIRDTHNPDRGGQRCVYGYYTRRDHGSGYLSSGA